MNAEWIAGNLAAHWLQAGVLAASAMAAMSLLRLHEPRARLAALHVTLIAILLLPAVQPWRPDEPALRVTPAATAIDAEPMVSEPFTNSAIAAPSFEPALAAVMLAVAGIVVRLAWFFYGIVQLARFGRNASAVETPGVAWALEAELGVSPRYVQQTGSRGPWTFGFVRPTIALPAGFDRLAPAFQRSMICHELVHVRRRDIAVAFCEELAVGALWFHPWMWLLRSRIRIAREQVVDARVVALLGNREEYVRCLVDISGHDLSPHFSQAGAGMLRPRELRARVDAMFREAHMSRQRFAVAGLSFVMVTVATGLVAIAAMPLRAAPIASAAMSTNPLPVLVTRSLIGGASPAPIRWTAAAPPQAAPEALRKQINTVYAEYPQDALERGIHGTVVVDITVNAAGEVTTAAVASGPQELRASAFKAALGLKYTKGPSTTAMKIAFEYVLTAQSWGVQMNGAAPTTGYAIMPNFGFGRRPSPPTTHDPVMNDRDANPDASGAYRIGGAMPPPKKLKDVPPSYPALAQQARVQGVVIMDARIDEQGMVSDVRTLRSIPLLDQAAVDAVKQWQYAPTLLNGVAVPVRMTVTVNFTLRPLFYVQLTLPDGSITMLDMFAGALVPAPVGRVQLRAMRLAESDPLTVSLFTDDGQTRLGDVVLELKGSPVQSPTTPSFGMQFLGSR